MERPGHSCSKTARTIDKSGLKGTATVEVEAAIKPDSPRETKHPVTVLPPKSLEQGLKSFCTYH